MSRRQELAARRAMLVARCETQRWELAIGADGLAESLHTVDAAVGIARRVASHPLLVAGAVVAAVIISGAMVGMPLVGTVIVELQDKLTVRADIVVERRAPAQVAPSRDMEHAADVFVEGVVRVVAAIDEDRPHRNGGRVTRA